MRVRCDSPLWQMGYTKRTCGRSVSGGVVPFSCLEDAWLPVGGAEFRVWMGCWQTVALEMCVSHAASEQTRDAEQFAGENKAVPTGYGYGWVQHFILLNKGWPYSNFAHCNKGMQRSTRSLPEHRMRPASAGTAPIIGRCRHPSTRRHRRVVWSCAPDNDLVPQRVMLMSSTVTSFHKG